MKLKLDKTIKVFILLISFGICLNINAEVRGMVAADCGMFIADDEGNDRNFKFAYTMSFLAYLSALDSYSAKNKLKGVSTDSIYYSVLQICKKKPSQRIDAVLKQLYFEDLK